MLLVNYVTKYEFLWRSQAFPPKKKYILGLGVDPNPNQNQFGFRI